eukprot:12109531-Alexandrium_andersonii.AAC.1
MRSGTSGNPFRRPIPRQSAIHTQSAIHSPRSRADSNLTFHRTQPHSRAAPFCVLNPMAATQRT